MDSLKLIDSVFESINTSDTDSDSRFAYLLFLFTQMKRFDFSLPDLDEKTTNYIVDKFQPQFIHKHVNDLYRTFVFMDVRLVAGIVLDKQSKVVEKPKFEPQPEPQKPVQIKVDTNYDPEADVLEEEGLIEPPPKREMAYNKDFMKSLGMLDE